MATHDRAQTRADRVRSRRKGSRPTARRHSRKRGSSMLGSHGLPPMVARRGIWPVEDKPRARTRPRRRFDIALGVPGAEVRLPALPMIRLGWRALSTVLVTAILVVMYTVLNSPTYQVDAAQVLGVQRLTAQEINQVMKVAGDLIFTVTPYSLQMDLQEAFPELYDIQVKVGFPAEVVVIVKERQPVLAWLQDGLSLWVDEQGVAFPPRGEVDGLVHVEAVEAPNAGAKNVGEARAFVEPEMIKAILTMSTHAPAGAPILYDSRRGLGWVDPKGWQVYFGSTGSEMEARLKVYEALVQQVSQEGVNPAVISVEFLHAPYYRLDR